MLPPFFFWEPVKRYISLSFAYLHSLIWSYLLTIIQYSTEILYLFYFWSSHLTTCEVGAERSRGWEILLSMLNVGGRSRESGKIQKKLVITREQGYFSRWASHEPTQVHFLATHTAAPVLPAVPCTYREAQGTGLLKLQIWGFNSEDEEHFGFHREGFNMSGNCKCYGFPAAL